MLTISYNKLYINLPSKTTIHYFMTLVSIDLPYPYYNKKFSHFPLYLLYFF